MIRILAGTDGSDSANRAIDFAARLARDVNGRLTIAHITGLYDPDAGDLARLASAEHMPPGAYLSEMAEQMLLSACERARNMGASEVRSVSQVGDIAASMIDIARNDGSDIIVVGKRGMGRLPGLLLGSVSQKLVSIGHCSVAVVP
jgi:nucleotide-binding universal stress UspA family protein